MSADRGRVIVVGSINVDLVVRVPRLPGPGETVVGGTFERHGGGKSANQAVAAARAGAPVLLVGAVGADDAGRTALEELRAEGVDTAGVAVLESAATGIAVIVVGPDGENQIAVASGANAALEAGQVASVLDAAGIGPGDVCLVGFEIPEAAVLVAAEVAGAAGAILVVNPAPARPVPDRLFELGPILTPNRGEATALSGVDDPEASAIALARRTGSAVVVTLGASGALVATVDAHVTRIPAPAVAVVDTTGAGDAFNGTLAVELAAGRAHGRRRETGRRGGLDRDDPPRSPLARALVRRKLLQPQPDRSSPLLGHDREEVLEEPTQPARHLRSDPRPNDRISAHARSRYAAQSRPGRIRRTAPSSSTRSRPGIARRARCLRRSWSWSITWAAVVGSLIPGESAREAMSTSCRMPNAGSWCIVRSGPIARAARTASASTVPFPRTRTSGAPPGIAAPTGMTTSSATEPSRARSMRRAASTPWRIPARSWLGTTDVTAGTGSATSTDVPTGSG